MIAPTAADRRPVGEKLRPVATRLGAAALAAAVLDAGAAFVVYVLVAHRYNFETLLQYIATGLLHHHAYRTGAAGVATAALGFSIHGALAVGFALLYAAGLRNAPHRTAGRVLTGLAYGATVWVVMAGAVLPILHVAHEPAGGRYWWAFLADHAFLVGLPIAWLLSAPTGPDAKRAVEAASSLEPVQ